MKNFKPLLLFFIGLMIAITGMTLTMCYNIGSLLFISAAGITMMIFGLIYYKES